jgi:NAD(P)-dependent dehydrogenase (short-subunit alcohol dehydrogenase family)
VEGVEVETLDLMNPSTIDGFVGRFLASGRRLDMLVNNAGIMASPLSRDARGYESQFATNHLGHFQLAVGLWPILRRTDGARIVSVSSRGHKRAPVDFDDPNFNNSPYDPWVAYGQSKSANALFAVGVDAVGRRDGVRAFAVDLFCTSSSVICMMRLSPSHVAVHSQTRRRLTLGPDHTLSVEMPDGQDGPMIASVYRWLEPMP